MKGKSDYNRQVFFDARQDHKDQVQILGVGEGEKCESFLISSDQIVVVRRVGVESRSVVIGILL